MHLYVIWCNKCRGYVTKAPNLETFIFAKNKDDAWNKGLQDVAKDHDVCAHGSDMEWLDTQVVRFDKRAELRLKHGT